MIANGTHRPPLVFYLLTQLRDTGKFMPVTVTGATSTEAARRAVETADVVIIGFRDSRELAAQEAAQLNAANGIVEQGCSTCG